MARSTSRNTGILGAIIVGFGRPWWIRWVEGLRLSAALSQKVWSCGGHIARSHQNKKLTAHAPNPVPRNNPRCRDRVCNSSCRAQVSSNGGRHDQSPNRLRGAAGCQRSSDYQCLDMTAPIPTERKSFANGERPPAVQAVIPVDNLASKNN
jgi:hypothetical protein